MESEKLIIVTHEFYPYIGGIATYVEETAAKASDVFDVCVWAPAHIQLSEKEFPFKVEQLPWKGTRLLKDYGRLALQARKHRVRLEQATVCLPEIGGILAYMLLGSVECCPAKRLVIVLHGGEILKLSRGLYRKSFLALIRRADRIGVVSTYVERLLLDFAPFVRDKIVLVPGGVRNDGDSVKSARDNGDVFRLLTVARIHPRKGQLEVLKALSRLRPEWLAKLSYTLVGPVIKKSYFRALIAISEKHRLPLIVRNSLSEQELQKEYARSDLFLMASLTQAKSVEGLGLVFLEAAAHRVPSVAYDSGGVSDAVVHEQTGLLVKEGDIDGLCYCIQRLIENKDLRLSLGNAAFEARNRFSWEKNVQKLFG